MNAFARLLLTFAALTASSLAVFAQSFPTSQPNQLVIVIERVKLGHAAARRMAESGWPAA
jgi:hypothetical protein